MHGSGNEHSFHDFVLNKQHYSSVSVITGCVSEMLYIENMIQASMKNSVTINFMWLYLKVKLNSLANKVKHNLASRLLYSIFGW